MTGTGILGLRGWRSSWRPPARRSDSATSGVFPRSPDSTRPPPAPACCSSRSRSFSRRCPPGPSSARRFSYSSRSRRSPPRFRFSSFPFLIVSTSFQWTRKKAVGVIAGAAFLLSIPCALAGGAVDFLTNFTSRAWGRGLPAVHSDDLEQLRPPHWWTHAVDIRRMGLGRRQSDRRVGARACVVSSTEALGVLIRFVAPVAIHHYPVDRHLAAVFLIGRDSCDIRLLPSY